MFPFRWVIGSIVLTLWLAATATGYWWFQARHIQLYGGEGARVPPAELRERFETVWRERLAGGGPTLVHFSRRDCACDPDSRAHLTRLVSTYQDTGLRLVQAGTDEGVAVSSHPAARRLALPSLWALVPSVPAAALFDAEGKLVYFGPYSSGPVCGTGLNFVEERLGKMRAGEQPDPWVNDVAFGCFCAAGPPAT